MCTDELISTRKKMAFLPILSAGNENSKCESNPIPYPLYKYFFRSAFLANLAPPNKHSFEQKSEISSRDHASNS